MAHKIFSPLQKELERADAVREDIIKSSRDVLKLSKKAIYALHRNDHQGASDLLTRAKKGLATLTRKNVAKILNSCSKEHLLTQKKNTLKPNSTLQYDLVRRLQQKPCRRIRIWECPAMTYLKGVCDLSGELVRAAVNAAILKDYERSEQLQVFIKALYDELLLFNFRNGPLRRKFDAVKYGVDKLTDLLLDLKLKGKLK